MNKSRAKIAIIKIIIGYALLAIVLLSATLMAYDNTRSLSGINQASEQLMARRDLVDSLVASMFETANAERSVLLGDVDEWRYFDEALNSSKDKLRRLRPFIADSLKRCRIDSLTLLLDAKRENTLLVLAEMGKDQRDIYYNNKVEALHSGRDSVVIHPKTSGRNEQHETVYEIVKSRRGFFRRLGDAFRRQHSDTIGVTQIARQQPTDTINHRLNIAGSVANALAQIRNEEQRANNRQQIVIANRNERLQRVSILLARRTSELLEDIQTDEHKAMRKAVDQTVNSHRLIIVKIFAFGLLAIILAAILVVNILRDIRRERRDRDRIVAAKAETERIMQQRERLLLTITHDIKAPAASIAGFISLLSDYVDRPKAVDYLHNIEHSAQHLLQLVTSLLDYHQLENGKAEAHLSSFEPASLVGGCVAELQPLAMVKHLELNGDIRISPKTMCRSDVSRLKQVVNNLVSNAIKYTDQGSITVTSVLDGNRLIISVADTGCGMTDDEQQRIFNAFTRLPGAQGKEGVGLGLSITREIVQLLDGSIRVNSQKGRGTKFIVTIPVEMVKESVENSCLPPTDTRSTIDNTPTASLAVLVIDDDQLQIQLLREMLSRIGGLRLDVATTTHADEALLLAQKLKPQLVFTDIEMPEINGTEMMRRLCGIADNGNIAMKFVAMTAHEPSILSQLRNEGFDACLFKPFSLQTLAATISQTTGILVRPYDVPTEAHEEDTAAEADVLHNVIMQFADGDTEAANQIADSIRSSVAEYLELLATPSDIEHVSRAAHKAMPLLEMLLPGENEWLTPIIPEHIGSTSKEDTANIALRLADKLRDILRSLQV